MDFARAALPDVDGLDNTDDPLQLIKAANYRYLGCTGDDTEKNNLDQILNIYHNSYRCTLTAFPPHITSEPTDQMAVLPLLSD